MQTRYDYRIAYFYVESMEFPDEMSSSMYKEHIVAGELYKGINLRDAFTGEDLVSIIPVNVGEYAEGQCFIFTMPDPIGDIKYKIREVDIEELPLDIVIESDCFLKAAKWLEERSEIETLRFINRMFSTEYLPKVAAFYNIIREQKDLFEEEYDDEDSGTEFEGGRRINTKDILAMLDDLYDTKPMVFSSIVNLITNVSEDL